jgi:deazaflavin-dependent oxidoreductase (nitroreductase family)
MHVFTSTQHLEDLASLGRLARQAGDLDGVAHTCSCCCCDGRDHVCLLGGEAIEARGGRVVIGVAHEVPGANYGPVSSGQQDRAFSLARLRPMVPADDQLFGAEHVRVYRETAGESGYHWRGTTILLLTTTGRSSGEPRTTPLIHRTDGDRWVIVASKGGASNHPAWYENLQADPHATIEVKGDQIPVVASTAAGEERARLWSLMADVWPAYDDYQRKTDREIPVVVLTRR